MNAMPIPRLIHPQKVTLELLSRDDTVWDPYAREPVGQAIREGESENSGDRVVIKAQVSFYFASAKQDYPVWEREGVIEASVGYIATRYKDLKRAGLIDIDATTNQFIDMKIVRGCRIVQIGYQPCDYYVQGFKQFAHYPRLNQTLIQINFTDRHPSSQQGDL